MLAPTPEQIAWFIATCTSCAAGYERFINRKKAAKHDIDQQQLAESMMYKERGDMMLKQLDEYKALLEKEYTAHQATREFHHEQSKLAQQKLSECNDRCQDLQSKTDLSRVEEILIRQMNSMSEMASGIKELLKRTP